MQLLPVLDISAGRVVRGVAGKRDAYQPVDSRLGADAGVLTIAEGFRREFDLRRLYVADLDAIERDCPNLDAYRHLAGAGFELLIDAGLRDLDRARHLFDAGAHAVIAGLETSPGPQHVARLISEFGADRVLFSLDLQQGQPLTGSPEWGDNPFEIGRHLIDIGVRRLIVLDLAGVGVASGVSTLGLCLRFREYADRLELITGGGVRDVDDLQSLARAGIDAALVASALHDGSITMSDVNRLAASG